ncbi:hypothetical protein [uncultured Sphingomonas sp.]|uniref:hypothetical protein n=1 Tax=uncultured Sphingomonas sp. TaxID=158754 RepID=UPI0025E6B5BF|nr:hypothetical protein [uncultured Sphingomonas sp.]
MALKGWWSAGGVALVLVLSGPQVIASGGPPPTPHYVLSSPQDATERAALAEGRIGIVKADASEALLYLDWRALNGLRVGKAAADALASPCCGQPPSRTMEDWITARRQVPGAQADIYYVPTERQGPDYTTIPTCFDDAFLTATATLNDRVKRYGAGSADVRAWLAGQDGVFQACSTPRVTLPALAPAAPSWLRADRAYQLAAIALYDGRWDEAAKRFAAIARDPASPWQKTGLYLEARATLRGALAARRADAFAAAHAAIDRLTAAPAGTYGRGEVGRMRQILEYHERPAALLTRLDRELGERDAGPDVAVAFRDYMTLSDKAATKPEAADWIRTLRPMDREAALAHAQERWRATGKSVWLVAALALTEPREASALVDAAGQVAATDPAWLTVQYHAIRLTMASTDPAGLRERVDRVLARDDLTISDRNIFTALRTQLATSLADFAKVALRSPYCEVGSATCIDSIWPAGDGLVGRRAAGRFVGFGAEARAIIDRLPLAERMKLAGDEAIPRELRLDLALTSYGRAVQLQDNAAIDRLAAMLETLLPQLATDWRRITHTPAGSSKRFAEAFVMAKIPSLRVDLADYARPEGTEPQFSGYWEDWLLLPPGRATRAGRVPPPGAYLPDAYGYGGEPGDAEQEAADLTCLTRCGPGHAPLHLPGFAVAGLGRAQAERRYFLYGSSKAPPPYARSLWDEMLAYVRSHPAEPCGAEALYRLIRVARWGGNHDHLGKRAFRLLHDRYARSVWARRSPYYYD